MILSRSSFLWKFLGYKVTISSNYYLKPSEYRAPYISVPSGFKMNLTANFPFLTGLYLYGGLFFEVCLSNGNTGIGNMPCPLVKVDTSSRPIICNRSFRWRTWDSLSQFSKERPGADC